MTKVKKQTKGKTTENVIRKNDDIFSWAFAKNYNTTQSKERQDDLKNVFRNK